MKVLVDAYYNMDKFDRFIIKLGVWLFYFITGRLRYYYQIQDEFRARKENVQQA